MVASCPLQAQQGGESSDDVAAAPAAQDDEADLGAMVISGEKILRTVLESTTSASLHSAEDLIENGDESLADLLNRVANANANEEGRISIRGISQTGAANGNGSPLISVQVDGVTLDRTAQQSTISTLFDVEQVEVLRGAQSTSQGRNALGGAMIVRTREPTWVWDSTVRAGYGSLDSAELGLAGGGPLGQSFAFRLSGLMSRTDGFITHLPTGDDEFAQSHTEVGRAKLAFAPLSLPGLMSHLSFSHTTFSGRRVYSMEPGTAASDPEYYRTNSTNEPTFNEISSSTGSWETEYDFGGVKLTAVTGWLDSTQQYLIDYDGLEDEGGTLDVLSNGNNLSQELRFNFDSAGVYSGVVGIYGGTFDTNQIVYGNDIAYLEQPPVVADYEQEIVQEAINIAIYTEFDIHLSPSLTATLGLRYDNEQLDSRDRFETTNATLTRGGPDITALVLASGQTPETDGFQGGETTYDALLPKLGLRKVISESWSVFMTYNEAYRAGGVDVDTSTGEAVPFDPEYTRNYEVGARAHVADWGLDISANVYYIDWRDQQVPVLSGQFFVTQNAANSRLYGAETSIRWQPVRSFSFDVAAGYANTEFLDFEQNGNDYSGNEFVFAPKYTGSVGATWSPGDVFNATVSLSHESMSYTQPDNLETERSDERQLLDARLAWKFGRWRISCLGRNLLDEEYVTYSFQYPDGFTGAPGARGYAAYGRPRTYFGMIEWML